MCVIMIAAKERPSEEMINRAFDHNKDGAGIAWRETVERDLPNGQKERVVVARWKKGLDLPEVRALCAELPKPYVVHFRVASVGGVRKSLTHPFPIGPDATLDLEGTTEGLMLFHNGHWSQWADKMLDLAISSAEPIPMGEYSDSRAMAWMTNILGPGFMELMREQKGVLFGPDTLEVFTGTTGWERINDVWCSNDYFWKGKRVHGGFTGKACSVGKCTKVAQYGKDICYDCEKAQKESANNNRVTSEVNEKKDEASLGVSTVGNNRPLDRTLTLAQAQEIHQNKGMSQRKMKKFARYYEDLQKGGNRAKRAEKELLALSREVISSLSNGLVH
jgi:hypothetical protein